jgi:uncharacterized protein YndB with AHSA1/START domain
MHRTRLLLPLLLAALPAQAAVTSSAGDGFEIVQTVTVKAAPAKVYDALLAPSGWWSAEHTYSGAAANLTIERRIGGCFCEKLPEGGAIQHLSVVWLAPGRMIGLRGALGPLAREGAEGTLYWSLKPAEGGGTVLTQSYTVGGYLHGDGAGWAAKVDGMLQAQLDRLARLVDTGSPEKAK